MKKLQVGIIEDEFLARETLQAFLLRHCENVEVIFMASELESGVAAIKKHQPDAVFLDIEMPGQSGMEIRELLGDMPAPHIIFTTAYANYAVDAFGLEALDYLLKPIDIAKLRRAVARIEEQKTKTPEKLSIPCSNGQRMIEPSTIEFLEAEGSYTNVNLCDGTNILVSRKLGDIEEQLSAKNFLRVHRSYLVNLDQIQSIVRGTNTSLRMKSGADVPVARNQKEALKRLFPK
ncbi:MAG: LytTR family DNA-binding domain-containing protein [Flavobacteriales bacterium]|jgi:two-component system LytT family response regulator|nr:LytTR family DNA-binding domain-containing protein [Flavobacteriales bacterium]